MPAAVQPCQGKACAELVEMEVRDVVPLEDHHAVVLVSKDKATVLPIFVDEPAAEAIAFRMAHRAAPHPQAQDLTDSMLKELGGQVTQVQIDQADDEALNGKVSITQGQKHVELAARPSDSIALALSHGVKIFATRKVLSNAGIDQKDIDKLRKSLPPGHSPEEKAPSDDDDDGTGGSGDSDEMSLPPRHGDPIRL